MKLAPNTTTARRDFPKDSRAAQYLRIRDISARGYTAAAAWNMAKDWHDKAKKAESNWEEAKATLAAYWESLGKIEPKRYAPEGERLNALRREERAAAARYFASWATGSKPFGPYAGTWQAARGHYFTASPDSTFRDVVTAEDVDSRHPRGFYDNPHGEESRDGSGLVIPYIGQLPGREGKARFVAGYAFGGRDDGGITFDLSRIFESHGEEAEDAKEEAARAACGLAESAAESERDYQTAAEAGRQWAECKESEEAARAEALAVLKERKAARGLGHFPALCTAIREQVAGLREQISESRKRREELAGGDAEMLWFYPDKESRAAFCDGAGLAEFPA